MIPPLLYIRIQIGSVERLKPLIQLSEVLTAPEALPEYLGNQGVDGGGFLVQAGDQVDRNPICLEAGILDGAEAHTLGNAPHFTWRIQKIHSLLSASYLPLGLFRGFE